VPLNHLVSLANIHYPTEALKGKPGIFEGDKWFQFANARFLKAKKFEPIEAALKRIGSKYSLLSKPPVQYQSSKPVQSTGEGDSLCDILRRLEDFVSDASEKGSESHDIAQKFQDLQRKLDDLKNQIKNTLQAVFLLIVCQQVTLCHLLGNLAETVSRIANSVTNFMEVPRMIESMASTITEASQVEFLAEAGQVCYRTCCEEELGLFYSIWVSVLNDHCDRKQSGGKLDFSKLNQDVRDRELILSAQMDLVHGADATDMDKALKEKAFQNLVYLIIATEQSNPKWDGRKEPVDISILRNTNSSHQILLKMADVQKEVASRALLPGMPIRYNKDTGWLILQNGSSPVPKGMNIHYKPAKSIPRPNLLNKSLTIPAKQDRSSAFPPGSGSTQARVAPKTGDLQSPMRHQAEFALQKSLSTPTKQNGSSASPPGSGSTHARATPKIGAPQSPMQPLPGSTSQESLNN
jgi:hypothetical protein